MGLSAIAWPPRLRQLPVGQHLSSLMKISVEMLVCCSTQTIKKISYNVVFIWKLTCCGSPTLLPTQHQHVQYTLLAVCDSLFATQDAVLLNSCI